MTRDQIMNAYTAQLARIQGSNTYSDHAKRVMAAKAFKSTEQQLETLRAGEEKALRDRRASLQRSMFGASGNQDPSNVIARRDANDRAAKLEDPRAAAEALARAEMEGDTTMSQAIATRAAQYGWGDVLSSYTSTRPGFQRAAEEFNGLPDPDDTEFRFRHSAQYYLPMPPSLDGSRPGEVERLAQTSLDGDAPGQPAFGSGYTPTLDAGDARAASATFGGGAA
ncbi:hypothetical protein [Streptomyces sp. SPB074]|uniref:hypothetical protein n=1 Tax=Streptomyces sp. (strain SPB074) TaxID=465543 RepID=UPI00017F27A6|nr:hypothetical protein [Streptomyces sp. SPB074]